MQLGITSRVHFGRECHSSSALTRSSPHVFLAAEELAGLWAHGKALPSRQEKLWAKGQPVLQREGGQKTETLDRKGEWRYRKKQTERLC